MKTILDLFSRKIVGWQVGPNIDACDKQRTVLIHSASRTHEGMFWEHRYRCGYPLIRLERCTNVIHNKKKANSKNKHNQLCYLCASKQVENLND